jgi:hypothetical protein
MGAENVKREAVNESGNHSLSIKKREINFSKFVKQGAV